MFYVKLKRRGVIIQKFEKRLEKKLILGKIGVKFFLNFMKYKLNMPQYVDRNIKKLFKYVFWNNMKIS